MKDEKKGAIIITGIVVTYLILLSASLGKVLDNIKKGNKQKDNKRR